MDERQAEQRKDLENMKENCKKIWKKWKKSRLNSEMIWIIRRKVG